MTRLQILITALAIFCFGIAAAARAGNDADRDAMRAVIAGQLQAFASGRDDEAYGYATPLIKFAFPTVGSFMAMVKKAASRFTATMATASVKAPLTPQGGPPRPSSSGALTARPMRPATPWSSSPTERGKLQAV